MTPPQRYAAIGSGAIILAALLWSVDAMMRQNLYSLPTTVIVFSEHFLGFLVTLPWLLKSWNKITDLNRKTWISIIWISIFGGVFGTLLYTRALGYIQYINFSVVVLLQKLQPVFAILLARLILKERPTRYFYLLAAAAIIASYFITFPTGRFELVDGGKNLIAGIFAVGAAFAWGSSTVMGKYSLRQLDTRIVTPLRLGLTTLITLIMLIVSGSLSAVANISGEQFFYLICIVFSSGTVALSIYYYGLKRVPASRSTLLELFWPLSAVSIDWLFFGHPLTWSQIAGALVLFAVILQLRK